MTSRCLSSPRHVFHVCQSIVYFAGTRDRFTGCIWLRSSGLRGGVCSSTLQEDNSAKILIECRNVQFSIFLAYDKWWSVFPIAGAQQDMPRQQAERYGQCCFMSSCVSSLSRNCLCTAAASLPICFAFSQARTSCGSLVLHRSFK